MATIPCSVIEYVHYSCAIEEKKYCVVLGAIEVHDSLHIFTFLHDTSTLMLDVPRVGKRMNKADVLDKRVEVHRFPTTEKEQQSSWWSDCTHNILYYSAI